MRILFVENRYATWLWQEAAKALSAAGHEIHWIVQNHAFAPPLPNVHLLPYPTDRDLSDAPLPPPLAAIARSDRSLLHFGGDARHYRHYDTSIGDALDRAKPDLVFGEPTQFHELITIAQCRARGIRYLAPTETRYPVGRLAFYEYDTFVPAQGPGEHLDDDTTRKMIDVIVSRRTVPAYMLPPTGGLGPRAMRLFEQARIAKAWFDGERFCTPSPARRLQLDRVRDQAREAWEQLALERSFDPHGPADWVLYPLQLQPESNLDVFGQPWIDQRETMRRAALALRETGARLVVKPNPKSKYEMSPALVQAVRELDNVVPLSHTCPMQEVFDPAPLLLTVTGTVTIESIFSGKPVAVLGDHHMARWTGTTGIDRPEAVADVMRDVRSGTARRATPEEALATARWLHATSYPARLWDPISYPQLSEDPAVGLTLRQAFLDVLGQLGPRTQPETP